MRYYFAPLEGITDWIFRCVHHKYFPGIDRYYTPFFSPTVHRQLTPREERELPPADSLPFSVVPQLLTKVPEDFIWMADQCQNLGYQEVNLNLGCPSGTVTAKGKGSGMLKDTDALDRFLDQIFNGAAFDVSVKTRIGFETPDEFPALIDIFNRYPIKELTVHPRVRKDFYKSPVDMQAFDYALSISKNPICYNGNICSIEQIRSFAAQYPKVNAIMLGRGLIGDPGMLCDGGTNVDTLEKFHTELLSEYTIHFGSVRNAMFRMKENWRHLLCRFENSEKLGKKLIKTTDINEFRSITTEIFNTLPLKEALEPNW